MRGALTAIALITVTAWGCAPVAAPAAPTPPPAAAAAAASPADPVRQLHQDITAAINGAGVQRGTWGIVVHSLARDERLFELNPRALLVPASSAKIVSVASAAEAVGWDYRFETSLRATGPIVDGTVRGDLLVVGSGDPSLGGRGGDDIQPLVDALLGLGIRRIDGRIIGDDEALEEPRPQLAWTWDDLGYPTGAIYGALNFAENRMVVTITPAATAGEPAMTSVDPAAAFRPLINRTVTGAPGTPQLLWPEQRPGETALTIAGSIPAGAVPARLSVSVGNPTLWVAGTLRHRLLRAGIEVTGDAFDIDDVKPAIDRFTAALLHTQRSRPLSEIARPALKDSINLYAEAALRLNVLPGSFRTNDAALAGLGARLLSWGIPPESQQLVDGSGLSRRDTIAPEALLRVLQRMYSTDPASPFVAALPIAGVDGSLANRMRNTAAQGNVRAKTGTMSNIRSMSGYVTTGDGEPLAFVIMVNNFEGTGAQAVQAIDAVAVKLAEFTRQPAP